MDIYRQLLSLLLFTAPYPSDLKFCTQKPAVTSDSHSRLQNTGKSLKKLLLRIHCFISDCSGPGS